MESHLGYARERSPRRRAAVKSHLISWAMGESSAVAIWRMCHAVAKIDSPDAGQGMKRLAEVASDQTNGSEQNCARKLRDLLAATALPKMIKGIPHATGEETVTHILCPTDLIRFIDSHIPDQVRHDLRGGPSEAQGVVAISIFASPDGQDFKQLHPALGTRTPNI